MKRIGITGGIGSGKSYICRQYALQGIPVYDCDSQAKRLEEEDPELRQALINLVGKEVFLDDGKLNKPFLASWLFSDSENVKAINSIIHPAVKRDFLSWCQRQHSDMVIIESAILVEAGLRDCIDELWLVTAPLETRILRAMQRDHSTRQQVLQRIAQQKEVENPDRIIENP